MSNREDPSGQTAAASVGGGARTDPQLVTRSAHAATIARASGIGSLRVSRDRWVAAPASP